MLSYRSAEGVMVGKKGWEPLAYINQHPMWHPCHYTRVASLPFQNTGVKYAELLLKLSSFLKSVQLLQKTH